MNKQILIVDDNPNMASLLSEMLEVFEYDSVRASNGVEAIDKIAEGDFSLVITDMRMPKMSGLDLLKKIKESNPDLPVVLISGYAVDDDGNEILQNKADGFLNKPFKMADIQQLLERIIK